LRGRDAADRALLTYLTEVALVVECVTNRRLVLRSEPPIDSQIYGIAHAMPVSLRAIDGGASGFLLDIRQQISLARELEVSHGGRQIEIRMYRYALLGRDEKELLAYHWHPKSAGPDYPHLHVSASLNAQADALTRRTIDLDKLHIVTGPVSLQAVVRMLITEFQVRPLRADWQERLDTTPTH
jgi:hypothetical protein